MFYVFLFFVFLYLHLYVQANTPEIRSFDDAIVMLSSANQSENTTVSIHSRGIHAMMYCICVCVAFFVSVSFYLLHSSSLYSSLFSLCPLQHQQHAHTQKPSTHNTQTACRMAWVILCTYCRAHVWRNVWTMPSMCCATIASRKSAAVWPVWMVLVVPAMWSIHRAVRHCHRRTVNSRPTTISN